MTFAQAREFFVGKVKEQADREKVDYEQYELDVLRSSGEKESPWAYAEDLFSKANPGKKRDEFERIVAGLLKRAYEFDIQNAGDQYVEGVRRQYQMGFEVIEKEECYIQIPLDMELRNLIESPKHKQNRLKMERKMFFLITPLVTAMFMAMHWFIKRITSGEDPWYAEHVLRNWFFLTIVAGIVWILFGENMKKGE